MVADFRDKYRIYMYEKSAHAADYIWTFISLQFILVKLPCFFINFMLPYALNLIKDCTRIMLCLCTNDCYCSFAEKEMG